MSHDKLTLPLFADEMLPSSPPLMISSLPAHWPPSKRENFIWWSQNGNNEMCAAVLWRAEGFTPSAAAATVRMLHQQPIALTHESPPCAHFVRPMQAQQEASQ